jgi:hypothetical protein
VAKLVHTFFLFLLLHTRKITIIATPTTIMRAITPTIAHQIWKLGGTGTVGGGVVTAANNHYII